MEAIKHIFETILVSQLLSESGPFDGVLGFSQGASMAHLLLAKWAKGELKSSKVSNLSFSTDFLH